MIYRFGAARLDLESRQLLCGGRERPLTPKAFNLLRLLLEVRPRVLTKAEIMDLIWPDTFVAEANVGILIGDIRTAIGDTRHEHALIKTHHGVGYSFCGEVTEQSRAAAVPLGGLRFVLALADRRILLAVGESTLGRDMQCDVIVTDPSVSRRHARFIVTPTSAAVEDLGSKNGTTVNGKRVTSRVPLDDSTGVAFGSVPATLHALTTGDQSTLTV